MAIRIDFPVYKSEVASDPDITILLFFLGLGADAVQFH